MTIIKMKPMIIWMFSVDPVLCKISRTVLFANSGKKAANAAKDVARIIIHCRIDFFAFSIKANFVVH